MYLWHEKYSLPYPSVVGFVACCVTLKTLGIGPHEQNWAAVKNIKTGKRVNLGGVLLEKQAGISKKNTKKLFHSSVPRKGVAIPLTG